jgi:hypothetical protein
MLLIHSGLATKRWPVDESKPYPLPIPPSARFNLENWHRLGASFTASVSDHDDWESVCLAFESMDNENRLMDEGDPRAFNEDRLTRVLNRDLKEALLVLNRLQTPLPRRFRRFGARMRRFDSGEITLQPERVKSRD